MNDIWHFDTQKSFHYPDLAKYFRPLFDVLPSPMYHAQIYAAELMDDDVYDFF